MFKPNVGTIDRTLRIGVGSIFVILAATGQVGAWGWIGLVPMATGLLRWCPAYLPFGLSTCRVR